MNDFANKMTFGIRVQVLVIYSKEKKRRRRRLARGIPNSNIRMDIGKTV